MFIDKNALMYNKRLYVMISLLCISLFILLYFLFLVLSSFIATDDVEIEAETQLYLINIKDDITFPEESIKLMRGEGAIRRDGMVCNPEEYGGSLVIGCPILIPDSGNYGYRYNPFDVAY